MDNQQLMKELMEREERLMDNGVRSNAARVSELMDDACVAVSVQGDRTVYRVGDTLAASEGTVFIASGSAQMSDLSPDCKLLSYVSSRVVVDKKSRSMHTSVWKKTDSSWKMVFHQGTACQPPKAV